MKKIPVDTLRKIIMNVAFFVFEVLKIMEDSKEE